MRENKRDIILNSAQQLMINGDSDITVDMIARNAGIGKGSIYYYFKSKDEIVDAVVERSYSLALREYFDGIKKCRTTLDKIRTLFQSTVREEFADSRKNVILSLHVHDDLVLHHKMIITAIKTISPILTELLEEGCADGTVHTDAPKEAAELIVSTLTFLIDNTLLPSDDASMLSKMKLCARVFETCLKADEGSFDFLFTRVD